MSAERPSAPRPGQRRGGHVAVEPHRRLLGVLGLTAGTVFSSADISGSPGALTPLAATTITNLRLAGTSIPTVSIAPNTVILNAAGVRVTLDEQVLTGAGTDNATLLVNAIDVGLTNAAQPIVGDLTGCAKLLNGSMVIGQSKASLSAVADAKPMPEPAFLLLCTTGLLRVGLSVPGAPPDGLTGPPQRRDQFGPRAGAASATSLRSRRAGRHRAGQQAARLGGSDAERAAVHSGGEAWSGFSGFACAILPA